MSEKKRIGIYICHCGGNISDVVDTAKAAEVLSHDPDVVVSKDFIFMCSDPGQKMIAEDVKANNLTNVVVASCSPRLHEMTFQRVVAEAGINPYTYRHVNIREQDSWVHSHTKEEATEKAIHLIRGGVAHSTSQVPLNPIEKQMIQSAAVIGGGVAGMTAALELAGQGRSVHLIEKSPVLGGKVLDLDKLYPEEIDAEDFILDLVKKVNNNDGIFVHLNTIVSKTSGAIGDFTLKLEKSKESLVEDNVVSLPVMADDRVEDLSELHVGTITIATGHDYYVPVDGEFGYNQSDNVITLPNLITLLNNYTGENLYINGKKINSIAMIHCVGSRQIEGVAPVREGVPLNPQCSRTCCTATLQQANRLKSLFPDINIYDFYRDIRTYGDKEVYYEAASKNNVIFIKYPDDEPPQVQIGKSISISSRDELTYGDELNVEVDLVVLAVGMIPRSVPKIVEDLSVPKDANNFLLEAHVKLRPVESATLGVFLAGTAQGPKDIKEATMSASASSAMAGSVLSKETINLSPFVAEVDENKCTGCSDCVSQCEYNAITITPTGEKSIAVVTPSLCTGCGACVAVCEPRAIDVQGFELDVLTKEVKAMIQEVKL